MAAVSTATPRRPRLILVPAPREYKVPTRQELRDARLAGLKAMAESMGITWGGVATGGLVTLHWPKSIRPNVIRGVPVAEDWLKRWKTWYDAGETEFYDWNIAVHATPRFDPENPSATPTEDTTLIFYHRLRAERAAL